MADDVASRASIGGRTRLLAILADPVAHLRTPGAMNAHFAALGQDAVLVPMHVAPGDLATVVDGLRRLPNLDGIIVTVPHKERIAALCHSLTEAARLTGAVNAIRRDPDGRLVGGQFDGEGFVAGLRMAGHPVEGRRVWMAGAGGAAAGIGFALLRHGASALTIHNRTPDRAEALAARLRQACPGGAVAAGGPDPAGHDIVVNATSLGLHPGDALPVEPARLVPAMLAAEVVMQPAVTPFLAAAAGRGCVTHGGLPMLTAQVPILAAFVTAGA
ncbi:shikimate dehydrogenase [Roseomonas sp. OT10]|uniref:shikimate dehydrogenase family protein n=1 Tax=Roseomonas cutis TaxID=2897332 RepID=UPI001E53DFC1|nr:shikimate dehydrogenase [Roseomonas sp. OT10]UFN48405.1 shikimate dehydrogenase [Roseomonas sp. OT10]